MNKDIFIFNLRLLRKEHHESQMDLSFATGLTTSRINQIENQPRVKIHDYEIYAIAEHYKVDEDPEKAYQLITTVKASVTFKTHKDGEKINQG